MRFAVICAFVTHLFLATLVSQSVAQTVKPTGQPSGQPSSQPICQPSSQPSAQPSSQPSSQPTSQPTSKPSGQPSCQPSSQPSRQPLSQPSGQPSSQPTSKPTQPSGQPSSQPTCKPSSQPSGQPSSQPTRQPSSQPSEQPSSQPSGQPSSQPTSKPTQPSGQPSSQPTCKPSSQPSGQPTSQPSGQPSSQPTHQPSSQPSEQPSSQPSGQPSSQPTSQPSHPSGQPSSQPTSQPSSQPTSKPTQPTGQPSSQPTGQPSSQPTGLPSALPTSYGTLYHAPSHMPSVSPLLLPDQKLLTALEPVSDGPPTQLYPLDFGDHVFSAIVLILCAGISSHLCFGYSTKQARKTFIGLILLLMLGFQCFHLVRAALYVPATQFQVYNTLFHRTDCLYSVKGLPVDLSLGGTCPKDGSASCTSSQNSSTEVQFSTHSRPCPASALTFPPSPLRGTYYLTVNLYISHFRNCIGGQGTSCTRDQPCFPCDRSTLKEWSGTGKFLGIARCRTCSTVFSGDCNFIPDVGPYCYVRSGSKQVAPCKRCCTEPAPIFVNGTCY